MPPAEPAGASRASGPSASRASLAQTSRTVARAESAEERSRANPSTSSPGSIGARAATLPCDARAEPAARELFASARCRAMRDAIARVNSGWPSESSEKSARGISSNTLSRRARTVAVRTPSTRRDSSPSISPWVT